MSVAVSLLVWLSPEMITAAWLKAGIERLCVGRNTTVEQVAPGTSLRDAACLQRGGNVPRDHEILLCFPMHEAVRAADRS